MISEDKIIHTSRTEEESDQISHSNKGFKPTGAIAFFILLVAMCLAIWFGIYFLMLNRI